MPEAMRMTQADTEVILLFYQLMNTHQGHDVTYGEMKAFGSGNPDYPLLGCRCNSPCDKIVSLIQLPRVVLDKIMEESNAAFGSTATCACSCGCDTRVKMKGISCPLCSVGSHQRKGDTD